MTMPVCCFIGNYLLYCYPLDWGDAGCCSVACKNEAPNLGLKAVGIVGGWLETQWWMSGWFMYLFFYFSKPMTNKFRKAFCWRIFRCFCLQDQTVSYNQLAQSQTSVLHWTGMRNARSEPMPMPGLTESFYTLSSLLSQFYPLFHSILIGHSSLEHVCTLEALSVIPYHP